MKALIIIVLFFLILIPIRFVFAESNLTCNYPWSAVPPVTHLITKNGDPVRVNLGFNSSFGGIGVKFDLVNKYNPNPIDILDARSAAGAAWQISQIVYGYDNSNFLTNQASGNGLGYQWGYSHNLNISSNGGFTTLSSDDWSPNPTDTLNGIGTSPCSGNAPVFDQGQPKVEVNTIPVSGGNAIDINSTYTFKSLKNQNWKFYGSTQAIYLNRRIARAGNFRLYLEMDGNRVVGPIRPYDDFTIPSDIGTLAGATWQVSPSVKSFLFVWNIFGLDIGILADSSQGSGSQIRLEKTPYCSNGSDDNCGSIFFLFSRAAIGNASFSVGQTRSYSWRYIVGTVPQLEAIAGRRLTDATAPTLTPTPTSGPTATPTPATPHVDGDFTGDGNVNVIDFVLFMNYWFFNDISKGDLNGDGKISAIDYTAFMNYWYGYNQSH